MNPIRGIYLPRKNRVALIVGDLVQSRDPQLSEISNSLLYLLTRLGNQHFRSAYDYSIVLIVLIMFLFKTFIKPIYEVRILVRPSLAWPDRFFPFFFGAPPQKTEKSGLATRD